MATVNKFESYAGGTGVYFEAEVDPLFPFGVLSPDFDLAAGTVTIEYQMYIKDSGDSWFILDVPVGSENHLEVDIAGIKRIRIENTDTTTAPYQMAVYQVKRRIL